jgi:DNA-binding transcriptional regulator YiaG
MRQSRNRTERRAVMQAGQNESPSPIGAALTTKQYRRALEELGLSQAAAAKYLGVTARTSQNWALGFSAVHPCAERLLRLLLNGKITLGDLE